MKRQLSVLIMAVMLGFSACGGGTFAKSNASNTKQVTIQEGETTDQIFFTNNITFTSSTPFVYMGKGTTTTTWQLKDMPYATYRVGVLSDEDYERIASNYTGTTKPEGIYGLGGDFGLGYTYFFVTNAKGKKIYITGDPSLENMADDGFYDNVAKTGEVFLQLVEDLVKSGNASADETSGVTIVRQEDQNPILSVYVHD